MGNYVSCTLAGSIIGRHPRATRVVFPDGEVRQFREPVTAAELMLEAPDFFLANSRSLRMGGRFSALGADEDLEPDDVYVMFPMRRLCSAVTAADLASLYATAKKASSISKGAAVRVLPEEAEEEESSVDDVSTGKLDLDEVEGLCKTEFMHRLSLTRSKKPLLETIVED
ncbi:hypothetical protein MLD38_001222 [Melastoma candidum]|uniref:Uncharacterized protein n=1 Tax=Melastoma candidum TaxID=119954 RepID=A0ACB9SBW8_9MYRT|nr:hypothetical protein MLD38_001222 [Melastoma candidum]